MDWLTSRSAAVSHHLSRQNNPRKTDDIPYEPAFTDSPQSQVSTPATDYSDRSTTMPTAIPINIATSSRTSSSSPSSQGPSQVPKNPRFLDPSEADSRTSAMMSGAGYDHSMGGGRQESFTGAKPISMNNPNRQADNRNSNRRESLAASVVGGMSWGGVSVGSWIRDE